MFRIVVLLVMVFFVQAINAQSKPDDDSVFAKQMEEITITSRHYLSDKMAKPLATLDNYLEKAGAVNMIRRGAYAWEPFINGMASERSVITIDGMRIYAACTDKMDPVTSYVEITNLAKANIHGGQEGSSGGATIAGSIDLTRKKSFFGNKQFGGTAFTGFETNNRQKIIGTSLSYTNARVFTDIDFTFRDAKNYKSGGGDEVLYSQFGKYNFSAIAGYKINNHQHLEASIIYDHAVNVGYPALTMDVASAKALIGSVEYVTHHITPFIQQWKTKLYYNTIAHVMDDSKRPDVPIRMDMPGWSKTAGLYSLVEGVWNKHSWTANLSAHRNNSLADMTMYSNNPNEKDMFMYTWPGVITNYADVFVQDAYAITNAWQATVSVGLAVHNNVVSKQSGLESLQIFYPDLQKSKTRVLKRISAALEYNQSKWKYVLGVGYGERAPSVSEGYGFYLFNSFDRFDYIGNPMMKNEKSININSSLLYANNRISTKLSGSYFYIKDYIIGIPHSDLKAMTIGANGVKVYEQLQYAQVFNSVLDLKWQINKALYSNNRLSYRRGIGKLIGNLPIIQPFSYNAVVGYGAKSFGVEVVANGAAKLSRYSTGFGETSLPAYTIFGLSASKRLRFIKQSIMLKTGVENIFDKQYAVFSDWNRIPRMGRNIFLNCIYNF